MPPYRTIPSPEEPLFLDNDEFLKLIKNDELLHYSEKIFGKRPDTELIYLGANR
jgi:hypothetical protein